MNILTRIKIKFVESEMQGKMGYIFFTICVGLVCFYIGRVEFLAEKLHVAEKMRQQIRQGNNPEQIVVPGDLYNRNRYQETVSYYKNALRNINGKNVC